MQKISRKTVITAISRSQKQKPAGWTSVFTSSRKTGQSRKKVRQAQKAAGIVLMAESDRVSASARKSCLHKCGRKNAGKEAVLMQDEIVERVVALCIQGGKISEQILKESIREMLAEMERHERQKEAERQQKKAEKKQKKGRAAYRGKQSMAKLRKQGRDLSSIEITDGNIKSFEKYARKYDVDYCLKKDRSSEPPRYFVFFKAADVDAMTAAFKEYTGHQMKKDKRESIYKKLSLARENIKHRELDKTKKKTRDQSL